MTPVDGARLPLTNRIYQQRVAPMDIADAYHQADVFLHHWLGGQIPLPLGDIPAVSVSELQTLAEKVNEDRRLHEAEIRRGVAAIVKARRKKQ